MIYSKLLIFDLDGTLIDSKQDIANAINFTRKKFNLDPVSVDVVVNAVGNGVKSLLEKLIDREARCSYEEALEVFRGYYIEHLLDNTVLREGALEILDFFKDKPKAVLTNKPSVYTVKTLEGLEIAHYFEKVECADTPEERKPNPSGALKILEHFKIAPEDVMMVGDSPVDIETGKVAGIKTCFIEDGYSSLDSINNVQSDLVIKSISELKERLD